MTDKLSSDLRSLKIDRSQKTGDRSGRKWIITGALVAIALLVAAGVAFMRDTSRLSSLGSKAREVETAMVVRQAPSAGNVVLTAGGYIIPRRRVEVSSKISGRVEELLVDKGYSVKAGQVLARLDDREYKATISLEALFYHNAIVYEGCGFTYFEGFKRMTRIHQASFQPGGKLSKLLNGSTPFRQPGYDKTIRGRSWAIHDGVVSEVDDDVLDEGWYSPKMYLLVGQPRTTSTFPDAVY